MSYKLIIPLVFLLVFFNINLFANTNKLMYELNHLSTSQYEVLLKTYAKGSAFNLELTMTAIAWQESYFGKWKINLADPSFGVFHNLISSVMERHNLKGNWNRSRIAEKLLDDYDYSFAESLAELTFWRMYWKNKKIPRVWSHMVMSYNAGSNYNNGKNYLKHIRFKIYALKKYIKQHKKIFHEIKYRGKL